MCDVSFLYCVSCSQLGTDLMWVIACTVGRGSGLETTVGIVRGESSGPWSWVAESCPWEHEVRIFICYSAKTENVTWNLSYTGRGGLLLWYRLAYWVQ